MRFCLIVRGGKSTVVKYPRGSPVSTGTSSPPGHYLAVKEGGETLGAKSKFPTSLDLTSYWVSI